MYARSSMALAMLAVLFCTTASPVPAQEVRLLSSRSGATLPVQVEPTTLRFGEAATARRHDLPAPLLPLRPATDRDHLAVLLQPDAASLELRVFDADGLAGTLRLAHQADRAFPTVAVHGARGVAAVGWPETGRVVLYGLDGTERFEQQLFADVAYSLEKTIALEWSPDGAYLVAAAMREAVRPGVEYEGNILIRVWDSDGRVVWDRTVAGSSLQAMAVGWVGGALRVAASTYDAYAPGGPRFITHVLGAVGEEVLAVPYGFSRASFGEEAVVLATNEAVRRIDLRKGEPAFAYEAPPGRQVLDALAGADGRVAVLLGTSTYEPGGFVYASESVLAIDRTGDVVEQTPVAARGTARPGLALDAHRKQLVVTGASTLQWIPWTE